MWRAASSANPPDSSAMAFEAGSVRYALRYWLIDPRDDDPTDSAVRCHLLAEPDRAQLNAPRVEAASDVVRTVAAQAAAVLAKLPR